MAKTEFNFKLSVQNLKFWTTFFIKLIKWFEIFVNLVQNLAKHTEKIPTDPFPSSKILKMHFKQSFFTSVPMSIQENTNFCKKSTLNRMNFCQLKHFKARCAVDAWAVSDKTCRRKLPKGRSNHENEFKTRSDLNALI